MWIEMFPFQVILIFGLTQNLLGALNLILDILGALHVAKCDCGSVCGGVRLRLIPYLRLRELYLLNRRLVMGGARYGYR